MRRHIEVLMYMLSLCIIGPCVYLLHYKSHTEAANSDRTSVQLFPRFVLIAGMDQVTNCIQYYSLFHIYR